MRFLSIGLLAVGLATTTNAAFAQKAYGPGVTDTEIKIGNTMPYSGPASGYAAEARAETAYYKMINSKGGVNGRKINFLSYDDAYSPPKTVEQTRKLVEQDGVLALTGTIGSATNAAVQKYMNEKKVPQLFVSTGASRFNDPKTYPWTVPLLLSYVVEGKAAGNYFLQTNPNGKIAILYQNDDAGKDYVKGFKQGLGDKASSMIVAEKSYEITQPTVDAEIVALKYSNADMVFIMATPKFGAQAIKKIGELKWKPLTYISSVTASIKGVLEPAGLENSTGLMTALFAKVAADPRWADAPDVQEFLAFMKEWMPGEDPGEGSITTGYYSAWLTTKILTECGDNLTRENLMKVVTSQSKVAHPLLQPGVTLTIKPDDYSGYKSLQMVRFNGKTWEPIGSIMTVD